MKNKKKGGDSHFKLNIKNRLSILLIHCRVYKTHITVLILITLAILGVHRLLKEEVFSSAFDPEEITLNYKKFGNGSKKLVLLHGLMASSRYWEREIDVLENDYDILMVDLLGFGDSPKPKGKYDLAMHLSALEKVIKLENFDSGDTVLVGHSLGATLSLALINKHPDWFEGVALISLPVIYNEENALARLKDRSFISRISLDKATAPSIHYPFGFVAKITWLAKFFDLPKDVYADIEKHTWSSLYGTLEEVILKTDLDIFIPAIKKKKILFIHGGKDETALIDNVKNFASKLPKSKFILLEKLDHHLFLKEPKKVWQTIIDFF